jgi:sialate O-acetylesterase
MNHRSTILLLLLFLFPVLHAQNKDVWQNKQCAVCLTYDDALNVDLDNVVPVLDSLGLKATFYVPVYFPGFSPRLAEWKAVAEKGNELGNHTVFHPCEGAAPGREWVKSDYDLNHYTVQRMVDEIRMANIALKAIDGKSKRTFAYPCGDRKAGDSSYVEQIKKDFIAARGVEGKMQTIAEIDLFDVGCYMINGQSGEELIGLVKNAMQHKALLVFLFHGVGGEHSLNVSLEAHSRLLHFLKQHEQEIWIAPMADVAEYIKDYRQKKD